MNLIVKCYQLILITYGFIYEVTSIYVRMYNLVF